MPKLKSSGKRASLLSKRNRPKPIASQKVFDALLAYGNKIRNRQTEYNYIVGPNGEVIAHNGNGLRNKVRSHQIDMLNNSSVHNHPDGGTFSYDDIKTHCECHCPVSLAVSPAYNYWLINTPYSDTAKFLTLAEVIYDRQTSLQKQIKTLNRQCKKMFKTEGENSRDYYNNVYNPEYDRLTAELYSINDTLVTKYAAECGIIYRKEPR